MSQHLIKINRTVPSDIEKTFDVFADHKKFLALLGGKLKKITPGPDGSNELGSTRHVQGLPLQETITHFVRPTELDYTITAGGGPVVNHLGKVRLSENPAGGTDIDYQINFEAKLPLVGTLVEKILGTMFQRNAAKFFN